MYPSPFRYHRARSLKEAASLLSELGEGSKALAGGQSLIPLMKLRLVSLSDLVDLNFIPGVSAIEQKDNQIHIGALARHADLEKSQTTAPIPIIHDCASGIADVQIRSRGTIGGSLAEADPSGDWPCVLLTLPVELRCVGPKGERTVPISKFFVDAYTSVMEHDELLSGIIVKLPPPHSGGAYLAFKRSPPVYPTASAAVQLTLEGDVCKDVGIALGCVGLTTIKAVQAEQQLRGKSIDQKSITRAAEAAMAEADPQTDMRGSIDYKRTLVRALVKRATEVAVRRARGEKVEVSHYYA
ncbi:MAG: xanthine dehydrogenase family protein subunit M [Acidobacteria bacterium]|nr:xanthine dehydrogenase family protein subunit M [Acidobacteriota bacterium]